MAWVRILVTLLALGQGGLMVFEGGHALVTGHYAKPTRGLNAGEYGPWAHVVEWAGVPAGSVWVKLLFLAYGLLMIVAASYFIRGRRWGRAALLAAVIGSLWYLGIGTLLAFTQILILVLLPGRPREPEDL